MIMMMTAMIMNWKSKQLYRLIPCLYFFSSLFQYHIVGVPHGFCSRVSYYYLHYRVVLVASMVGNLNIHILFGSLDAVLLWCCNAEAQHFFSVSSSSGQFFSHLEPDSYIPHCFSSYVYHHTFVVLCQVFKVFTRKILAQSPQKSIGAMLGTKQKILFFFFNVQLVC